MPKEHAPGQRPERQQPSQQSDQKQPDSDTTDLDHEATQRQYRKEYLEQQRRQNCPGCGDDGSHF